MFEFTDAERHALNERKATTIDEEGREVLAGLTFDETMRYMEYSRRFPQNWEQDEGRRKAHLELRRKHQQARQRPTEI